MYENKAANCSICQYVWLGKRWWGTYDCKVWQCIYGSYTLLQSVINWKLSATNILKACNKRLQPIIIIAFYSQKSDLSPSGSGCGFATDESADSEHRLEVKETSTEEPYAFVRSDHKKLLVHISSAKWQCFLTYQAASVSIAPTSYLYLPEMKKEKKIS